MAQLPAGRGVHHPKHKTYPKCHSDSNSQLFISFRGECTTLDNANVAPTLNLTLNFEGGASPDVAPTLNPIYIFHAGGTSPNVRVYTDCISTAVAQTAVPQR